MSDQDLPRYISNTGNVWLHQITDASEGYNILARPNDGYTFAYWAIEGEGLITDINSAKTKFKPGEGGAIITAEYFADPSQPNCEQVALHLEPLAESEVTQSVKLQAQDTIAHDNFGISCSVQGDRLAVGAVGDDDNGSGSGSVYIFELQNGTWTRTAKFQGTDTAENDDFGRSCSLQGDRLAVGAIGDDDDGNNSGSVYIFELQSGTWTQTAKFQGTDTVTDDTFGMSCSLQGDRLAVGAIGDDDNGSRSGSVYIFELQSGTWTQTAKLPVVDDNPTAPQVTVRVGSGNHAGYIDYTFAEGHSYTKFTVEDRAAPFFRLPTLRIDGTEEWGTGVIQVGSIVNARGGMVEKVKGNYFPQPDERFEVVGTSSTTGGWLIRRIRENGTYYTTNEWDTGKEGQVDVVLEGSELHAVGTTLEEIKSAIDWWGDPDITYFVGESTNLAADFETQVYDLIPPVDFTVNDNFGMSCSLQGDRLAVGARLDDDNGSNTGSVYIFELQSGAWTQTAKFQAEDVLENHYFGTSCSLQNNRLAVGALGDDSVYIFELQNSTWTQIEKIEYSGTSSGSIGFGVACSLEGGRLAVGAFDEDYNVSSGGSVSIYQLSLPGDIMDISSNNHAVTLVGDTVSDENNALFAGEAIYFDGDNDYLQVESSSEFNFGTTDFTIEFWINFPSESSNFYLQNNKELTTSEGASRWFIAVNPTSIRFITHSNGGAVEDLSIPESLNTWNHIAFVRENGVIVIYYNGAEVANGSLNLNYDQNGLNIGSHSSDTGIYPSSDAYIQDFRISKKAVYKDNFVRPTSSLTNPC